MADLLEDGGCGCCPDERSGTVVVLPDVVVDGADQLRNATESPAPDPLPGDFGEPSLNHVQPGSAGRREVQVVTRVRRKPLSDLRVLMRSVVVQNEVNLAALRRTRFQAVQKGDELAVPMPGLAGADYLAGENVERRK